MIISNFVLTILSDDYDDIWDNIGKIDATNFTKYVVVDMWPQVYNSEKHLHHLVCEICPNHENQRRPLCFLLHMHTAKWNHNVHCFHALFGPSKQDNDSVFWWILRRNDQVLQ